MIAALIWLVCGQLPDLQGADMTREEFGERVGQLKFFMTEDLLYDRDPFGIAEEERVAYSSTLAALLSPGIRRESLVAWMKDPDPKVRTLAMAALFHREDPQDLPRFAALRDDPVPTLPFVKHMHLRAGHSRLTEGEGLDPQTVGDVARGFLWFWGCGESFEEYWEVRGQRPHNLLWLHTRWARATGGTSSTRLWKSWKVGRLWSEIRALPQVPRDFYLLALFGGVAFVPDQRRMADVIPGVEQELVFACRRLGPRRLLALLQGKTVVDDPDWDRQVPGYFRFSSMAQRCALELAHRSVLRSGDAAVLWDLGRELREDERWMLTGALFRAAARLQPEKARAILLDAWQHLPRGVQSQDRTDVALLWWELLGPAEAERLIAWFYAERDRTWSIPPRARFVEKICEAFGPGERGLLVRLVGDPAFDQLDLFTLKALATGLNKNLADPVIPPGALRSLKHPLGEWHFQRDIEKARQQYPEQTARVLAAMAQWRDAIRASIPRWSPGER